MRPSIQLLLCGFVAALGSVAFGSTLVVSNVESELPPGVITSAGTQTNFQQANGTLMAAPEPGTAVLLLAGVPFLLGMRFRSARC